MPALYTDGFWQAPCAPIAWVISSRNTTEDIKKWLSTLFEIGMIERPDWQVHAFIIDDAAVEIEALRWFA